MLDFDPLSLLRPKRSITGMSAVLLPFDDCHRVDWNSFDRLLDETVSSGLLPVVNMDTGYATLITATDREWVLDRCRVVLGEGNFAAGAFNRDTPKAGFEPEAFDRSGFLAATELVASYGALPVVFQNFGLTGLPEDEIVGVYQALGEVTDRFLAFELGMMFADFGRIYSLDTVRALLDIPQCIGMKHSSFDRVWEWQRIALRNEIRPDFMMLTGNDRAIDMVMYGADYLLGLSAFAPDVFRRRDLAWETGDPDFFRLNDGLQALGSFTFRDPVPGYRANCAQFLKLRGWISTDKVHRRAPGRPTHDIPILKQLASQIDIDL